MDNDTYSTRNTLAPHISPPRRWRAFCGCLAMVVALVAACDKDSESPDETGTPNGTNSAVKCAPQGASCKTLDCCQGICARDESGASICSSADTKNCGEVGESCANRDCCDAPCVKEASGKSICGGVPLPCSEVGELCGDGCCQGLFCVSTDVKGEHICATELRPCGEVGASCYTNDCCSHLFCLPPNDDDERICATEGVCANVGESCKKMRCCPNMSMRCEPNSKGESICVL